MNVSWSEELRYFFFHLSSIFNKKQAQNDDQFTEHFSQKLSSGIARKGL